MKIALYRGRSLVSKMIEWITRSPFSHAAFLFDEPAAAAALVESSRVHSLGKLVCTNVGAVVEAWQGGVKNSPSMATLHTPGTIVDVFTLRVQLGGQDERDLVRAIDTDIGDPYSYWNVLRFITRVPGKEDGSWFCSELVFQRLKDHGAELLCNKAAWAVPPDWLQMSPLLRYERSYVTGHGEAVFPTARC